jgi:hypothetical protein
VKLYWLFQLKGTKRPLKARNRIGDVMPAVLVIDDQNAILNFLLPKPFEIQTLADVIKTLN